MPRRRAETRTFTVSSAVGYTRVSTFEQSTEGVSLEAQEVRIRAYCLAAGLDLLQIVREEGVSGAKPLHERPAGSVLIGMIGQHKARHVVALKLDRVFRDAANALEQTRKWDQAGVALHLLDMGGTAINTASAMGRMMLTMMAAFAELERNLIAERTALALRHMKDTGAVYARVPLGYQRVDDRLVEDRGELAVVERIRDWRMLGWTYTRIANQLNADGVPTKRSGIWHPSTIRYIARNDLYDDLASRAA